MVDTVHQLETLQNNKLKTMKKIDILYTISALLLIVSLGSCKKDDFNAGGTATQSLANEWWVRVDGGADYYTLFTYNTAANIPTEMWVDDGNNNSGGVPFWQIKGKVQVNGLTFSGTNIANQDYVSTFTITNGKVIPKGTKAPGSKNVTDSVYMQIQFSDDPGVTHTVAGYARTKFPEDDH